MRKHLHRALLGLTTTAVLLGGTVAPAQAAVSPEADSAGDWLADQVDSGIVTSEYHDGARWVAYDDFGLTLDVYFAFDQLGIKPARRQGILDAVEPRMHEYTDVWGTRYAGAIGKLLTAVEAGGRDPRAYGDEDLVAGLEDLVVTAGPERGRAKDNPTGEYESSNTFSQAFVATALAGADSALADEATEFLLKQQCADGFFRQDVASADFTCDGGTSDESKPSVDATATAAMAAAALAADGPLTVREDARLAFRRAVAWLVSRQVDSGTFAGGRNTNSTGLAASALILAGKTGRATKAAEWIDRFRVTRRLVRTTAYRAADLGAIAYNAAAFRTGKDDGITRATRYEWRRATAQAAPALDLLG